MPAFGVRTQSMTRLLVSSAKFQYGALMVHNNLINHPYHLIELDERLSSSICGYGTMRPNFQAVAGMVPLSGYKRTGGQQDK